MVVRHVSTWPMWTMYVSHPCFIFTILNACDVFVISLGNRCCHPDLAKSCFHPSLSQFFVQIFWTWHSHGLFWSLSPSGLFFHSSYVIMPSLGQFKIMIFGLVRPMLVPSSPGSSFCILTCTLCYWVLLMIVFQWLPLCPWLIYLLNSLLMLQSGARLFLTHMLFSS